MTKTSVFIVGCLVFVSLTEAQDAASLGKKLYCHVCTDASSNDECNRQGVELCQPNENACQTEIRTSREKGFTQPRLRITKRCKQGTACEINQRQNTNRGWKYTQCNDNPRSRISVCRYCCEDTNVRGCNRDIRAYKGQCPTLTNPPNGNIVCNVNANTNAQECRVQCRAGYLVTDITASILTCRNDGTWSGSVPSCDEVGRSLSYASCPLLKFVSNGQIKCSTKCNDLYCNALTSCSIKCDEGYKIAGPSERTCSLDKGGATARWNPPIVEQSQCQAASCVPFIVSNAAISCSGNNGRNGYGAVCTTTCNYGYEIVAPGDTVRICRQDGVWSGRLPICRPTVTCPTLQEPENGRLICTAGVISQCTIRCNEEYYVEGKSDKIFCQAGGIWSDPNPTCKAIKCITISLGNGRYACSGRFGDYGYLSTCNAFCDAGFELSPPSALQRVCQSDATWSGEQASCTIITCAALLTPKDSSMVCTRPNGVNMYQSICSIYCNDGFEILGPSSTTCVAKNRWSNDLPVCRRVTTCSKPDNLANGEIKCSGFQYADTCKAACNKGYELVGSARRQCGTNAVWTGTEPECVVKKCRPLQQPANGRMACLEPSGKDVVGAVCTLVCDRGYYNDGLGVKSCLDNKSWSGSDSSFSCKAVECSAPETPSEGELICSAFKGKYVYKSKCAVKCASGFQSSGQNEIECGRSGKWIGNPLRCEQTLCAPPFNPANGYYNCDDEAGAYNLYFACTLQCNEGYVVAGVSRITCSTGEWPKSAPTCEAVECPVPETPSDGALVCSASEGKYIYGSKCAAKCADGYRPSGQNEIECGRSGRWIGNLLRCEQMLCVRPFNPTNGYYNCDDEVGAYNLYSTCTLRCNMGYMAAGIARISCLDGKWPNPVPSCKANTCEELKDPANGKMICTAGRQDRVTGTYCKVLCDYQYTLYRGIEGRECRANGSWDGTPALCAKSCAPIATPPRGSVVCVNVTGGTGNEEYTSMCKISCGPGSIVATPEVRVCYTSGQWSITGPTCTATCGRPPTISNGNLVCVGTYSNGPYPYGTPCDVTCLKGYTAVGPKTRTTCRSDGTWSYIDPACQPKKEMFCNPLAQLSNGKRVCSSESQADGRYPAGTQCSTLCYSARSSRWLQKNVCSTKGKWLGEITACPIDCRWSWSPWSSCDYTGRKSRRVIVLISPKNGGEACPETLTVYKQCCQLKYRRFGNICFTFHCDNQTWARAEENCRKTEGNLAKVNTVVKQQFLKRVLEKENLPGMWIGLSRNNGQYAWTDGSLLGVFGKWFDQTGIQTQPDNYRNVENCVKMTSGWSDSLTPQNFDWNDVDCNSHANYICENTSGACGNIY